MGTQIIPLIGTGLENWITIDVRGRINWQLQSRDGKPMSGLAHYGQFNTYTRRLQLPELPIGSEYQLIVVNTY